MVNFRKDLSLLEIDPSKLKVRLTGQKKEFSIVIISVYSVALANLSGVQV